MAGLKDLKFQILLKFLKENFQDNFGFSMSLNDNGDVIAIGSPNYDGNNGTNSGYVKIYNYMH